MTVTIHLPSVLRSMANGQAKLPVDATTVAEAVEALCRAHPRLQTHLLDAQGQVRGFVRVFIDQEDAANLDGLETKLRGGEVLRVVPAIAGGDSSNANVISND